MARRKDTRWDIRVSSDHDVRVRSAAETEGQSLTDFVIGAAAERAERILGERTRFVLDPEQWKLFEDALERPVRTDLDGLARLFDAPGVFEREGKVL